MLISLFFVLIIILGWALSLWFETGPGLIAFAVVFAIIGSLTSYYGGASIALSTSGAHPLKKEENPYVYRLVENLAITAGLPMPKVYIINDPAMNAFATGRDPQHASVALTTGLIEHLENEELEGVIAHELAHVKNYDIRLMTVVIVCVGMIALISDIFLRSTWIGSHDNDRRGGNNPLAIVGLVLILLSPLFAKLIQLAVSRKREYLADASGALLTRYPAGLASALEKIGQANQPMRRVNRATAHLFFSNPFGQKKASFTQLFATHPPIEARVAELRKMA